MAQFSNLVITQKGQELLAKIISGTKGAVFTKISTSTAEYSATELEALSTLPNVMQTSVISGIDRTNGTAVRVEAAFTNTELTKGYFLRTIGLFAQDPECGEILYAACREVSGGCYVPAYNGVTVSGIHVQLVTTVGNAENVSLEVDPAGIVTVEALQNHNSSETAHENILHDVPHYKVLTSRTRDLMKPDYGLGGGGDAAVVLELGDYTGNAEISVLLGEKEYDGKNISQSGASAPNNTLIIQKKEI